jgi:ubiquitin-conjugating enzyme E2 Z
MISAITRIKSDINNIINNPLENDGIYVKFDESNIFHAQALIIGVKETPYEGGFFVFDINFPENYPLSPPTLKFETIDTTIRFNPNLYREGKVCLSIINTWHGPQWTPCNSLRSVLISLLAMVFNNYPLQNEPGHQNDPINTLEKYNQFIQYQTLNVNVIRIIETYEHHKNSVFHSYFLDIMKQNIINKYDIYKRLIQQLSENDGKLIETEYKMKVILDYTRVLNRFNDMCNMYKKIDEVNMMNMKQLYELSKKYDVDIKKKSLKTSKMINKTKYELITELVFKIKK